MESRIEEINGKMVNIKKITGDLLKALD